MVTIVVGPEKVKFVAHEQVISHYSTTLCAIFAEKTDAELFTFRTYKRPPIAPTALANLPPPQRVFHAPLLETVP